MSLRAKTLAIFGITLLSLLVLLSITARFILLDSYEELEQDATQTNIQRLINTLNNDINTISSINDDYARWDDTYAFIEDVNPEYFESNLGVEAFQNLDINLMIFVNGEGERVFERVVDLDAGTLRELPAGLDAVLGTDSPFMQHNSIDSSAAGIVLTDEGALILTSEAIVTSLNQGPVRGALIFGRFIDNTKIQAISDALDFPVTAHLLGSGERAVDIAAVAPMFSPQSPTAVQVLNANTIAGYAQFYDFTGTPALILRMTTPRDLYQQGVNSIWLFVGLLVGAGAVFSIVSVVLLERTVLSRLTKLSAGVDAIRTSRNLSERVTVSGSDELGVLGKDINEMLQTLEDNQKALRERDASLRTFVRSAPIMLWGVDSAGFVTILEGNMLEQLGFMPGRSVGKTALEVFQRMPEIATATRQALDGEDAGKLITTGDFVFDVRFNILKSADGKTEGVICVATDITERVKTEAALNQAYRDLERQASQLERAHLLFTSTLDQLTDTVQRGSDTGEIREYLDFMRKQFPRGEQP